MNYTDEYLVDRIISKLETHNTQRFSAIKPLIEKRNRKKFKNNFIKVCESLHRDSDVIKKFIETQLQISTSVSADGVLIIDKTYNAIDIQKVFASYIKSYVLCGESQCRSGCTQLLKDSGITYLICNTCNCKKSIKI